MQPSSATPPLRRGWWSRPITTYPTIHDREPTCSEEAAYITPYCGAAFTIIAILVYILSFVDHAHFNAKFSIQSIAVSPSSATWHVDFLVKNPSSSRYYIYYGGDETEVRVGPLNTAVLNTSHEPKSRSHTVFSVNFIVEDNPNNVVLEQLDIKLRAKHKVLAKEVDEAGHIDIRCRNLTRSHENVEKIQCHSSFTRLKALTKNRNFLY